jgi:hypothetical protein
MTKYLIYVDGSIVSITHDVILHQIALDYFHNLGREPIEERVKSNGN